MRIETTLLAAVTADGSSDPVGVVGVTSFTAIIHAASVTTGATVAIESRMPTGIWAGLDSRAIAANGDTFVQFSGPHVALRATLSGRTDGTYTVAMIGA